MTERGPNAPPLFNLAGPVDPYPSPYIVQDDFLPPDLYQELKKTFPPVERFGSAFRMQGELTWGDETYMSLLNRPGWRRLHEYIYSEVFVRQVCTAFSASLAEHVESGELLLDLDDVTYEEHMEGRALRKELLEDVGECSKLYTRLDLGYGIKDYGRHTGGAGIHIDNSSRLFSLLVYFSSSRDFTGGEFEVYECRHALPRLYKRIATVENRAILSLQNNAAYHAVNPITECAAPRYALYIAIASRKRLWKRISNPLLALLSKNRSEIVSPRAQRAMYWVVSRATPLLRIGSRNAQ